MFVIVYMSHETHQKAAILALNISCSVSYTNNKHLKTGEWLIQEAE